MDPKTATPRAAWWRLLLTVPLLGALWLRYWDQVVKVCLSIQSSNYLDLGILVGVGILGLTIWLPWLRQNFPVNRMPWGPLPEREVLPARRRPFPIKRVVHALVLLGIIGGTMSLIVWMWKSIPPRPAPISIDIPAGQRFYSVRGGDWPLQIRFADGPEFQRHWVNNSPGFESWYYTSGWGQTIGGKLLVYPRLDKGSVALVVLATAAGTILVVACGRRLYLRIYEG